MKRNCILFGIFVLTLTLHALDLLPDREWELAKTWNATGSLAKSEDGSYLVENTTPNGYLTFNCSFDEYQRLVPGKSYLVRCELERSVPTIKASLFLSLPGARRIRKPELRTEFESTDTIEISFTAKEGERRLALYLMLSGVGKTTIRKITLEEISLEPNLLKRPGVNWRIAQQESDGATFTKSDGVITLRRIEEPGYAMILNTLPITIVKGKSYRLSVKLLQEAPRLNMGMMFSTGKRSPWPSVPAKGLVSEWETLEMTFRAEEGEENLTVYVVMRGKGSAQIRDFLLEEVQED